MADRQLEGAKLLQIGSDPLSADCPGREVFNHITSRWALLIVVALGQRPLRFHALRDRVDGISEKMLSQTLRSLTRDGLVSRSVLPTNPPQVTYSLTDVGHELFAQFSVLIDWMGRRVPGILESQRAYDLGMSGNSAAQREKPWRTKAEAHRGAA